MSYSSVQTEAGKDKSKTGVGVFSLTEIKKDTVILNNKYKNDIHISWNSVSFLDNNVLNHIKSMCFEIKMASILTT